ncbi:MAG TPA: 2'-5' RNA ligase family protein, partial [Polyangiaceae bacterium]
TRPFRPHVTLARLKRPSDVRDLLEGVTLDPISIPFDELRLYRSLHDPAGGRYSVLARAEFRGSPA